MCLAQNKSKYCLKYFYFLIKKKQSETTVGLSFRTDQSILSHKMDVVYGKPAEV